MGEGNIESHHVGLLSFKKFGQPQPGFKIWLAWIK